MYDTCLMAETNSTLVFTKAIKNDKRERSVEKQ